MNSLKVKLLSYKKVSEDIFWRSNQGQGHNIIPSSEIYIPSIPVTYRYTRVWIPFLTERYHKTEFLIKAWSHQLWRTAWILLQKFSVHSKEMWSLTILAVFHFL